MRRVAPCVVPIAVVGATVAGSALAAGRCPPLPAPTGRVVSVATVPELEAAVATLTSGTTVLVADGIYDLSSTLVVRGGLSGVAVRGASGDRDAVVIRGRGMSNPSYGSVPHGFLVQDASDVLLADLTVRDAYYHNVQIQGERGARGVRLYNVRSIDAGEQHVKGSTAGAPGPYADDGVVECSLFEYTDRARSDYTNGVDVLAGAGWVIRDNVFRNIRGPVGTLAGPTVLMWRNSLDSMVERNLFIDCDRAVALGLSPPDGNSRDGETTYDHQGGIVRNNIVYRPAGSLTGDTGITVNYCRDYAILHNTVVLNGTFPWAIEHRFDVSDGRVENNLTDGPILARDGASATLVGNVGGASPSWFLDAAGADLHLVAGAVLAIDVGVPLASVSDDFDGEARPVGPASDVGADEYGACVAPASVVTGLVAVRAGADVSLRWDARGSDYNVWFVRDGSEVDRGRLGDPIAMPVPDCLPTTIATCTDAGAMTDSGYRYYQVRGVCGTTEGP